MYVAQQIGRYHLLDRIAIGGMAEIYRAITFDSAGNQHMVAIKRVLRQLADDDDFLQMLVDEAKIAICLIHPNIAKVYEFVRIGEDYFIAMEYVDGKDVRSILERMRRKDTELAADHCAYIIMRVLDALRVVHDQRDAIGNPLNIVHRDISPSNLLLAYDAQIKLCDFGIAKTAVNRIQTRVGVIKGKVKYMSPEQAMGHPLDRRSDLFSAGSVLYELLTRRPPFRADNETDLIFAVRDARIVRPCKINPKIPKPLDRIVRKALARAPNSRYQDAGAFAHDLRLFLGNHSPTYSPDSLARVLRQMYALDIEKDLRLLEQFVIGETDPAAVGDNLLAEVLGEGAAYTKFSAAAPALEEGSMAVPTKLLPRVPAFEERLPPDVDLHEMKTQIIDLNEQRSRKRVRQKRPRPGQDYRKDMDRATQQATLEQDSDATDRDMYAPDGGIHDPGFHEQPTRIIRYTPPDEG